MKGVSQDMSANRNTRINIAIDGPAGAGKSTVARKVASALEYVYVDTGAMYRAVTLSAQQSHILYEEEEKLKQHLQHLHIAFEPTSNGQLVILNNQDVTASIRSREVTSAVSHYAAIQCVRDYLGSLQRKMASDKGIVMDGRDIGTHVLPDAEVKIFLTASAKVRALRRYNELTSDNYVSLEQLEQEIIARDELDQTRTIAPLVQASDAILIDSSHLSIEEVVAQIVELGRKKLLEV